MNKLILISFFAFFLIYPLVFASENSGSESLLTLNLATILERSEAHEKGLWHRSAHIWVYNDKSEILLQLRSANKIIFPNRWDVSSAGHIGAGEIPLDSAIRELKEEIGITDIAEDLHFNLNQFSISCFDYLYLTFIILILYS